jgi:hypothetical protein
MADDRGGGQFCSFRGQHEVNLELSVELNRFLTRNNIPERLMFAVVPLRQTLSPSSRYFRGN